MRFLLLVCATPDFAPDMETMPAETKAWTDLVEARDRLDRRSARGGRDGAGRRR